MERKIKQEASVKFDTNEFMLPETVFSRDIDNRVFQGIIIKTLSEISGIGLLEGNFLDTLIGRIDRVKGITTDQDPQNHAIKIRIEINIRYGISIPQKAEEIQTNVVEAITKLTGVRISEIHVVFKELITKEEPTAKQIAHPKKGAIRAPEEIHNVLRNEFEESDF